MDLRKCSYRFEPIGGERPEIYNILGSVLTNLLRQRQKLIRNNKRPISHAFVVLPFSKWRTDSELLLFFNHFEQTWFPDLKY